MWIIFAVLVICGLGTLTQATEKVAKNGQQQAALTADLIKATIAPEAFKAELAEREAKAARKRTRDGIMGLVFLFVLVAFIAYVYAFN